MENAKFKETNTLFITVHCFKILLDLMLTQFQEKHKIPALGKMTQLYGFGNYNPNLPNLKQELEQLSGGFINGKYLYDKSSVAIANCSKKQQKKRRKASLTGR